MIPNKKSRRESSAPGQTVSVRPPPPGEGAAYGGPWGGGGGTTPDEPIVGERAVWVRVRSSIRDAGHTERDGTGRNGQGPGKGK